MGDGTVEYTGNDQYQTIRVVIDPSPTDRLVGIFERIHGNFTLEQIHINSHGEEVVNTKHLGQVPLDIKTVVRIDDEYLGFSYEWMGKDEISTVDDLVLKLATHLHMGKNEKLSYIAQTLNGIAWNYSKASNTRIVWKSPIRMVDSKISCVDIIPTNVKDNLALLRELYNITTNQRAFLSVMSYCLTAPLHYHIKNLSNAGYIVPYEILVGRTTTGKTALAALFVLEGYAQNKQDAFLSENRIKTLFTLTRNMSYSGNTPVILNDVSMAWLMRMTSTLKSGAETGDFGERGNKDKSTTLYEFTRSPLITSNEDWIPTENAAMNRRLIVESYTLDMITRVNEKSYRDIVHRLQYGFMYQIFSEIFNGKDIAEVVSGITADASIDFFVQYGIDRINELCRKYNIEEFPNYTPSTGIASSVISSNPYQIFIEEILEADARWQLISKDIRAPYPLISPGQFRVDRLESNNTIVHFIYFQASVYVRIANIYRLPHKNVSEFFNNYVDNPRIKILGDGKPMSKQISGQPKYVYGLTYTCNKVELSQLKAIRYIMAHESHAAGEEDIVDADEADILIKQGKAIAI